MKFFLGMFLASEAMLLAQSVDNGQRVSTRKLAKYAKSTPCTVEVGELKGKINSLQVTNSVLKNDIDVLQKQCAPAVVPGKSMAAWNGDYVYPGFERGVYELSVSCDSVGDICTVSDYRIGTVIDSSRADEDPDDTDIPLGGNGSNLYIRPSEVLEISLRCYLSGTFKLSESHSMATEYTIPLEMSDGCSDDHKGRDLKYVVQLGELFGDHFAGFSRDGGMTYYTDLKPYILTKVPSGARIFNALTGLLNSAIESAVHVAVVATNAVGNLLGVGSGDNRGPDDPNNPTYPNGTPVNYTNPFNPFAYVAPGWVGGFSTSNPGFAYPNPDLDSIPVETNMANIDKLTRMIGFEWPEFSWEMVPGRSSTRIFTTFASYISRLGYDDTGRVWSIICPQQGFGTAVGNLDFEVTVTGTRGWTDEVSRSTAVEMGVMGQMWFSANEREDKNVAINVLFSLMSGLTDLPLSKSKAIQVLVNRESNPNQPLFTLQDGIDPTFNPPYNKVHWNDGAIAVVHLRAQIGDIVVNPDDSQRVTAFKSLVVTIFNMASGNLLLKDNILSWNIWMQNEVQRVNQTEWLTHAERWRDSLNTNLTYPDQDGNQPTGDQTYFDGSNASPFRNPLFILEQVSVVYQFINDYYTNSQIQAQVRKMHDDDDSFSESDEQEFQEQLEHHRRLKEAL